MTRLVAGALLFAAACNPGDFSDLEEDIWVDSTAAPDSLHSDDYGAAVAFGGSSGAGASIVVVSREPAGVIQLDYDPSGDLDRRIQILNQKVSGLISLTEPAVIATEPDEFDRGAENVAIAATNDAGVPYAVLYSAKTFEFAAPIAFGDEGGAPISLAFGRTSAESVAAETTRFDLAALAGGQLWLAEDYATAVALPIARVCQPGEARSLVIADIDAGSPGDEIVLATAEGLRYVSGLDMAEQVDGLPVPSCPLRELDIEESDLGPALATGDFDESGAIDVAVGAPAQNAVYVLMNGGDGGVRVVDGPSGSASFGASLAAGDFDRDGVDDLVVGDPGFGGEVSGGGAAYVLRSAGDDFEAPVELHDVDPEKNQRFGRSVAVARWNGDDDILVVGASEEVFTYFRLPLADSRDVRTR